MAKPARYDHVPTVAEVIRRSVEACDPDGTDPELGRLERVFEDDDEPISAVSRFDERLAMAVEGIDSEGEVPAVSMATATALYLWHRRDEVGEDDDQKLLRLAARAKWPRRPPEAVSGWLAERGVAV